MLKRFLVKSPVILFVLAQLALGQVEHRKALVIGNNAYSGPPFEALRQAPVEDAAGLADALVAVGFLRTEITVLYDLHRAEFWQALLSFRNTLNPNDSVLFYFSGHGFSIGGQPYLVPLGFAFGKTEAESRQDAIDLEKVIDELSVARTRVFILDACRTSAPLLKEAAKRGAVSSVSALTAVQGNGSLVAYATGGGKASSAYSDSGMSLFTNYLVRSLKTQPPPIDMLDAIRKAKADTANASKGAQVPAVYDEMDGSFILSTRPQAVLAPQAPFDVLQVNPYQQVKAVSSQNRESGSSARANAADTVAKLHEPLQGPLPSSAISSTDPVDIRRRHP